MATKRTGPVLFTFSDVQWCRTGSSNDALSYTQMSITTYGSPIPAGKHAPEVRGEDPYNVSEHEAEHLRARVGRPRSQAQDLQAYRPDRTRLPGPHGLRHNKLHGNT